MFPEDKNLKTNKNKPKSSLDMNKVLKSIDDAFDLYIGVTFSKPGMHTYLVTHGDKKAASSFNMKSKTSTAKQLIEDDGDFA